MTQISDMGDPRTYAIIGAAMEVHQQLGRGFLEAVYQEALVIELTAVGVPWKREVDLPVYYKGNRLATYYRADFICFDSVLVELKAVERITRVEQAQVMNYLKATGYAIALLLNFGSPSLEYRRFAGPANQKSVTSVESVVSTRG